MSVARSQDGDVCQSLAFRTTSCIASREMYSKCWRWRTTVVAPAIGRRARDRSGVKFPEPLSSILSKQPCSQPACRDGRANRPRRFAFESPNPIAT